MIRDSHGRGPWWLGGVLLALVLIVLSSRGRFGPSNPALQQRFKPQPTAVGAATPVAMPQFDWSLLSSEAQQLVAQMQQRLHQGESTPVLTPVAQSTRLRVEVAELRPKADGVQVVGKVTNISGAALDIPVSAFQLRDSANAVYAAGAGGGSHLAPGESTPLDLTVPLPAGRGLSLLVRLPPDPPLEQVLLVALK